MASCHTWANTTSHIRHPWFDNTIAKRKHSTPPSSGSSSPSPDVDSDDPDFISPPLKRRRCSTLEHGIAHLTLNHPFGHVHTGLSPSVNAPERSSSSAMSQVQEVLLDSQFPTKPLHTIPDVSMDTNDSQQSAWPAVVLPSSVEEPHIPEIKMKSSSWYEPEPDRIVITDLDSSDEDEDDDTGMNSISINPAYLERMRSQSFDSWDPYKFKAASSSQALVLFKPLPHVFPSTPQHDDTIKEESQRTFVVEQSTSLASASEDAMDVEP